MFDFTASDTEALPSATVIVLRDGREGLEVLLLQRNPELRTMGGAWVFPGGKVDPDDPGSTPAERARHAAVRELAEEAALTVRHDDLEDFSHWLTPVVVKARFATWFYVTRIEADTPVTVDGSEIVAHQWIRPFDAIDAQDRGELTVPPPTLVSLLDLSEHETAASALAMAAKRHPPYFFPTIVRGDEEMVFLYPGDAGYEDADPALPGPRHRTVSRDGRFQYFRDIEWRLRDS
ncbi:MAG: NUDIX hydrolase [Halieaceae bacterium]|jgi:8-oxo-dGTP pyrophosphatase MutT (NUDIX family)|nr:NUDIX hydrolase [Halieaceae bacterium]